MSRDEPTSSIAAEREALLAEAERIGQIGSYVWNFDTGEVLWTDELFRILGQEPGAPMGLASFVEAVHPDDRQRVRDAREQAFETGVVAPEEFRIIRDGQVRYVRGRGVMQTAPDGTRQMVGIIQDITELRASQVELEELHQLMTDAERVTHMGSWTFEPETARMVLSDQMYRIMGRDVGDPKAISDWMVHVHPADLQVYEAWWDQVVQGRPTNPLKCRCVQLGGDIRHVESHAVLEGQRNGQAKVVGITRDITEQTRLEERLRHMGTMEAIGTLAAGIAHDFNNYLTVIHGALELIQAGSGNSERLLTNALHATDRCTKLTSQLLAYAAKQPTEPRPTELGALLERFGGLIRRVIGATIRIVVDTPVEPIYIIGDPAQLESVLMNLAANAKDAMPDGGTLSIAAFRPDLTRSEEGVERQVVISVSDTGTGMPPEIIERIFDPYFTTKERGQGTGLGLATVFGIVNQHDGQVLVSSIPGDGTTFELWFPEHTDVEEDTDVVVPTQESNIEGRVLVVEDTPEVRALVVEMLQDRGYATLAAQDGLEALRLLESESDIAVVLTDVTMPTMGGPELAETMKRRGIAVPIVVMTGYSDRAALDRRGSLTGVRWIQKPFDSVELISAIQEALP